MIKIINYKEEIYGNMAMVYHRTSYSNLINSVYTEGFKPGKGALYGKGFYSTYDLASQESSYMKDHYGSIVVKFSVSLSNFFIFDYDEYIKAPLYRRLKSTKDTFIQDQVAYFKINLFKKYKSEKSEFSSSDALYFYRHSDMFTKVDGIIYTGDHDGKCLVAYNTSIIMPVSYRVDGENNFEKIDRNKEYFKKVLKNKLSHVLQTRTFIPKWIERAYTSDAKFDVVDYNVVWHSGTWRSGRWEQGTWEGGTWEGGFWLGGTWENGTWQHGLWKKGSWEDGTWEYGDWENGLWQKGLWEYGSWHDGIWYDGTWKDGEWEDGTWVTGTWEQGTWDLGTWNGGTWENGYWVEGEWLGGIWEQGTIYSDKFDKVVNSRKDPAIFYKIEAESLSLDELKEKVK